MDLVAWNQRLAEHFGALGNLRKDIPVFALEHGLAPPEVLALSNELRAHILKSPPDPKHSLVWTVYAAEIGYGYAGDEYWQTFEEKTPGWTLNARRDWIRDAFIAFQRKFAGAKPSGPWAQQFSIIAWPITHAILPRDLQQQLARILYDLRHSFSAELFEEPQRLGDFIAARSWNSSARFQNLVQAPALVGQIAAALLLQGREGFKPLLHPVTLKRIGDDVDRERRGRDWLRGARRAAEERAKIRGLSIGAPTSTTFHRREDARAEIVRLGIEPRLVLRPIDGSRWEVSLEIPDLSHLLLRFPQVRDVLTESRCTVAGATGRPLARGRCLHGPQRVPLSRWPRPDDVLLKFERTDAQLEYLLRAECMLRPGSSWLFKVSSDGLAYESRALRVRADSKYVLISTEPLVQSSLAQPLALTCQGAHAALLDVPTVLTSEWEQTLKQLQVTQAKSIEVWPAGLAAVAWDGEGHGEWLASETPTLAIRSDHAMDELTIAMGDRPSLSLSLIDTPPGEPIFVEFPPLPVGLHKFRLAARSGSGEASEVIGDLEIVMRVREARPWSPGSTTHGPLEVELDPATPSLEQLWEGTAAVLVRGPAGRQVNCRVQLFARAGDPPLIERQLPPLALPLSSEEWVRHFEVHVKSHKDAPGAYDDAHVCEVEFAAEELGVFTLRCEREFTPLRWTLRRNGAGFIARLSDDAGSDTPTVSLYSFEQPAVSEELPRATEYQVPRGGGLYVASLDEYRASIVAPPVVRGDFAELKCAPRVESARLSGPHVLLSLARLWGDAHLPGDVHAGVRHRLVLREIAARFASDVCGNDWGRAEANFSRGDFGIGLLRRAVPEQIGGRPVLSANRVFPDDILQQLFSAPLHERGAAFAEFAAMLERAAPTRNQLAPVGVRVIVGRTPPSMWLAEFALRAASAPATVERWAGERTHEGVTRLCDAPTLLRAARFLVLAVDRARNVAASGEVFAGWRWSA